MPGSVKQYIKVMKEVKISVKDFNLFYGNKQALKNITIDIYPNKVTAFIGPSGCGKSTFIRSINRMNDLIDGVKQSGKILIDDKNIYDKDIDVVNLRKRVGMVFQKSNLFPMTIFENIIFGVRINGMRDKKKLEEIVEYSLKNAALFDEVKDRLHTPALSLSGGQQQRLCIARTLAIEPEIILMDEPASALDPISTAKIEDLIHTLKKKYTLVVVTHNMQQAARVSDHSAFFYLGELIEYSKTSKMFTKPSVKQTEDYITGRFG